MSSSNPSKIAESLVKMKSTRSDVNGQCKGQAGMKSCLLITY